MSRWRYWSLVLFDERDPLDLTGDAMVDIQYVHDAEGVTPDILADAFARSYVVNHGGRVTWLLSSVGVVR